jgi:hypothetical protein
MSLRPFPLFAALCLASTGCVGEADFQLAPSGADPANKTAPGPGGALRLTSFSNLSAGLPVQLDLTSMAHFDGTVYALASTGGATELYSLSSGATAWSKAGPAMRGAERPVLVVRFDLAVYLAAADSASGTGSLWRLELGDDVWRRLSGAPDLAPSALLKKSGELLVAYSGSAGGLFASADDGLTWKRRAAPSGNSAFLASPVRRLVSSPASPRLFAGTKTGLYTSDNAGATWTAAPIRGEVLSLDASEAFVLAEVALGGTQRSDNYGNTWHPVVGLGGPARCFFLAGARSFAGTATGVKLSDDGGANWRDSSAGLPSATDVHGLYLAGTSLFASTAGPVYVAQVP